MNLTQVSYIMLIILFIPFILFVFAVLSSAKDKKGFEIYIKPITFILYTGILFNIYRVGLKLEMSDIHSINFIAFTAAIKTYVGEFQGDIISTATNNQVFATLLYLASILAFLFVFYNVFGLILKLMANNLRLKYYKKCKNYIIFGNDEKINSYIKSLEKEPVFRFQRIKFFLPNQPKIIIVLPKEFSKNFILTPTNIKPAYIYTDAEKGILQKIIDTNSHREQTVISLYEEDEDNIKLISSISKMVLNEYIHFTEINNFKTSFKKVSKKAFDIYKLKYPNLETSFDEWLNKNPKDEEKNLFEELWIEYHRLKHKRKYSTNEPIEDEKNLHMKIEKLYKKFVNSHFNIKGIIHFSDLSRLDLLEMRLNLKYRVDFYSQNALVGYRYSINHPIMEDIRRLQITNKSEVKVHYIFLGFGLTNRNILKSLLINNIMPYESKYEALLSENLMWFKRVERVYSIISNDNKNTIDHFKQSLNFESFENKSLDECLPLDGINIENIFGKINFKSLDATSKNLINYLDGLDLKFSDKIRFIVALGDDILNIDIGHKILDYVNQNKINDITNIDLRIIDDDLDITPLFGNKKNIVKSFGKYCQVYSYQNIINKNQVLLAKGVHEVILGSKNPWSKTSYFNQLSSMYSALSIRNKLIILGLDISSSPEDSDLISDEEYYKIYDPDDLRLDWYDKKVDTVESFQRYKIKNIRDFLAQYEHLRWNAYKLLQGFVPMPIAQLKSNLIQFKDYKSSIKPNPAKNEERKLHACITTNEGLIEYGKIILSENIRLNLSEEYRFNPDKIQFDYRMMDYLPQILKSTPYFIVKHKTNKL